MSQAPNDRPPVPPEDRFAMDLDAISIVPPPKGKRRHRTTLGLDQGPKRLLGRVLALSRKKECYASDAYLAWALGASIPSVSRWIAEAKEFGILDVKGNSRRRLLSINGAKLAELKAAYLKALAERERRWEEEANVDGHPDEDEAGDRNGDQVDRLDRKPDGEPDQLDGRTLINWTATDHQLDREPNQLDRQIDNRSRESGNRESSDNRNNAAAAEPAPATVLSLLLCRIRNLREQESSEEVELEECRERLDAISEELRLKGFDPSQFAAESRAYRDASERCEYLTMSIEGIQVEAHSLGEEIDEEEERLRLEEERLKAESERIRAEAELDSWRRDPEHRILADAALLLDAFQACCRRRFPGTNLLFPKRENQVGQAANVLGLIEDQGQLDEIVLRTWLSWYPNKCLNAESPAHHITIRWLGESWNRFRKEWPVPSTRSKAAVKAVVLDLRRETGPMANGQAAAAPAADDLGVPE